jgi:ERCC4-related helicase
MPIRFEDVIEVKMDSVLKKIDALFISLLKSTEAEMEEATMSIRKIEGKNKWKPLSKNELKTLKDEVDGWKGKYQQYFSAVSAITKYYKLLHAYTVCMTDGYGTFQAYVKTMRLQSAKAALRILNDARFKEVLTLADGNNHPKALAYKKHMENFPEGGTSITFVGQKDTGNIIHSYLKKKDLKTDIIYGGKDKDEKKQDETLQMLRDREVHHVVATSVLHEGIHVPEINQVINYSVPKTTVARIQSNGRTARTEIGRVVNIILDHPFFDKGTYYSTVRKERKVKEMFNPQPALQIRGRNVQLGLFPNPRISA